MCLILGDNFFYSLVRPQRASIQCWHFGCLGKGMPHHKRWMAMEQWLGFLQQHERTKNSKHHLEGQGLLKETLIFYFIMPVYIQNIWRWASVGSTTGLMSKRFKVKGNWYGGWVFVRLTYSSRVLCIHFVWWFNTFKDLSLLFQM